MMHVGIGVAAASLAGAGYLGYKRFTKPSKKIDEARDKNYTSVRFPYLESGAAYALEQDGVLDDLVERLSQYFRFDEEVGQAFAEAAAGAAEFLMRKDEIKNKRSIPIQFRGFTHVMVTRTRELRRAIRDAAPAMLEEFDEVAAEVKTYQADMHHNLWCDAHAE